MSEEVKARIFEPFFTTKVKGKGTGLGLAMVYGTVKQSEGHIEVDSKPGEGTTFRIYLPCVEESVLLGRAGPSTSALPQGSETILLVEDEEAVRALTSHIFQSCGYVVLEAADGSEAVRVATHHRGPIQLLATDVVMPGIGGRELASMLRSLQPEVKVLFLSGYTDEAIIRPGAPAEKAHFLQKPYSPLALAQKVREVLDEAS
jgi:two-component system, cell cycle sensor histidine kinase and response regulator CckA